MSNTESNESQTKVFIVEHNAMNDQVAKDWLKQDMQPLTVKANRFGFVNHLFMPTPVATKVFGIWEIGKERTVKDLQKFFNEQYTQDSFIDVPLEVNFQANPPLLQQLKEIGDGKNEVVSTGSKFYLVEHHATSDTNAQSWWQNISSMKEDDWSSLYGKQHAAGFHNTFFIPTMNKSKIFCLWEISSGKTVKDLQYLLNTADYTEDKFTDVVMEMNVKANPLLSKKLKPYF